MQLSKEAKPINREISRRRIPAEHINSKYLVLLESGIGIGVNNSL